MKRGFLATIGAASALAWSSLCFATTIAVPMENVLLMELQQQYPDFQFRDVKKTDIENVFEVTIRDEIGYLAMKKDEMALIGKKNEKVNPYRFFFLGGNLVDLEKRENLTAQARERVQRIDVKKLPIKDAITEKRGTGERVLYVFSDVDCGYCRRLHTTLTELKNVTIHTFLIPMAARYDVKKAEKSAMVWCDRNKVAMLDKAMKGEAIQGIAGCETPILSNLKLADRLYVKGTPTVFFADGTRVVGNQLKADGFEERFKKIANDKQKTVVKEGKR